MKVQKNSVKKVLAEVYKQKVKSSLRVQEVDQANLNEVTVTKDVARLQSREERLKRRRELLAKVTDQEDVDDQKAKISAFSDDVESIGLDSFEMLKVIGRGSFGKVMQV